MMKPLPRYLDCFRRSKTRSPAPIIALGTILTMAGAARAAEADLIEDMVNPGTLSFDLRKFPKDDPARFRNSVLNGKNQGMPAWRDKLSDDDIAALWAYVRSGG
jgi:Cytochrome C oxidase, cbb3-type, subunit III